MRSNRPIAERALPASGDKSFSADLARLVAAQVDARMDALSDTLIESMVARSERLLQEQAAAGGRQLDERIGFLERTAAGQVQDLARLQEMSGITAHNLDRAVRAIDQTLGKVSLDSDRWAPALTSGPNADAIARAVRAGSLTDRRRTVRKHHCPKCGSSNIRQSQRTGFLEQFLRVFFLRPLRCHSCLRRFYRF